MDISLEVSIHYYEGDSDVKKRENILRRKLEPFICGYGGTIIGNIYRIEYKSEIYFDIMNFAKENNNVGLGVEYYYKYSNEELKKAKLFWLNPDRSYIQSKEYNEYPCDTCGCRILMDKATLKVGKKIKGGHPKRIFKFGSEIEELLCLSVDLYKYVIENGVNGDDFSPVYCGSEIQGYALTPKKEYNIRSSVYDYRRCDDCDREYAIYNIEKGYDIERFEMCEPIDCSEHDVFRTEIYFDREQRILISPKFFNLIRDYIKEDEYIAIF